MYEHKDDSKIVLNQNNVYILNELLTNTTNPSFKDYTVPTALSLANKLSHKYALKTGTTNTDYWTIGYNKDALMLIWVGYDDAREINQDANNSAKAIWLNTIESIESDNTDEWYEQPVNVIATIRDSITGGKAKDKNKSSLYYFVKGSENLEQAVVANFDE